ncbi:helix-turn-helix transcriptional regulator [Actinocorallia sp. B10E7]|uniref:helix-turn-helix transcriptional regulator n=1 Tax=Actinocorallia sp. B10E7 TaxID=3153558 RepID=UPI00325F4D88
MSSSDDAFWRSTAVRHAAHAGQAGTVIRLARERRDWSQDTLAALAGYSRSTISRLESGRLTPGNLPRLQAIAQALNMPPEVFAVLTGMPPAVATTVVRSAAAGEDDPMRRRSLIAAGGLALPLSLLSRLDDALAVMPIPSQPADLHQLLQRLGRARKLFDDGHIAPLVGGLPDLLAAAHAEVDKTSDRNTLVILSAAYGLAAGALTKVGIREQARLTADRAVGYAERSEDPIARAAADRQLAIVLRHEDRRTVAQELTVRAAVRVEKTGLTTRAQSAAYAQMLCTAAYSAAQAGDRSDALEMMGEAKRAARLLPAASTRRSTLGFALTTPEVRLYEVGVLWSLGDAGHALAAADGLRAELFPTAERRGRYHTDLARAWWQRGKAEQTAAELLSAMRQAPAEVRDRPAIRAIADELVARHRLVPGARELAGALGSRE